MMVDYCQQFEFMGGCSPVVRKCMKKPIKTDELNEDTYSFLKKSMCEARRNHGSRGIIFLISKKCSVAKTKFEAGI